MPNFFSSIIKQKKIIIFAVLFLVIFSFIFPQQSLAQESPNFYDGGYAGQKEAEAKYGENCQSGLSWYESIGTGLIDIVLAIPKTLANLATWFTSYIIARVTDWPITHTDPNMKFGSAGANAFINGWSSVRDLANMLVVLGFVIIGIATTLRIRDYEAKKFLLPLILAALLVNFSGLFVGLIIDASTLTMNGLLQEGTEGKMGISFLSKIQDAEKDLACAELRNGKFLGYVTVQSQFALIYIAVAIAFIYLAFILTARYAVLGILFMLSPLAFVFWAFPFPKAKDLWNKWWESFIKWAFIGVGIAFFLNITAQMLAAFPLGKEADPTLSTIFFYLTIVLIFLVVGIKITTKTSAIGAAAVMGLAGGAVGLAAGAAALGGKKLADKAGLSRAGTGAKDIATRGLEGLGLMKPGTTTANQQARLSDKDRMNRVNSMSAEQMAREITNPRIGQSAHYDRAAMVKKLAQDGKLDLLQGATRDRAIQEAMSFGVGGKDLITSMQSGDIATVLNDPTNRQFNPEARAEGFKALSKRNDLDLITAGNRQAALDNAVRHGARIEEIEKSDYHYGTLNEARRQRIRTANPGFTDAQIADAAIDQTLDEHLTSMPHEQLRNIDAAHLTARRVDRLTPDKINAFQYAPQASRDALKDQIDPSLPTHEFLNELTDVWNEYNTALTAGDQATASNRYAEFRRKLSLYKSINNLP